MSTGPGMNLLGPTVFAWVVLLVEPIWTRSQSTTHLFWYVPQTILRIVDSDLWQSDADRCNDLPLSVVLFRGGPEPTLIANSTGHIYAPT